MPFYGFRCSNGHAHTLYSKIADRDAPRQCEDCGANLHRRLEAPVVKGDIQPYRSPIDGHWVDSSAARREELKRHGCIDWEPGIRQDLPKLRKAAEDRAFAPLEATIEKTARELVASGKLDPL